MQSAILRPLKPYRLTKHQPPEVDSKTNHPCQFVHVYCLTKKNPPLPYLYSTKAYATLEWLIDSFNLTSLKNSTNAEVAFLLKYSTAQVDFWIAECRRNLMYFFNIFADAQVASKVFDFQVPKVKTTIGQISPKTIIPGVYSRIHRQAGFICIDCTPNEIKFVLDQYKK